MTIHLTLNADTVNELHAQMRELLGSTAITVTGTSPPLVPEAGNEPKRQTAAERKAAEKAAKEAAEAAAKAAQPETATQVEESRQDAKDEAAEKIAPEPMKLTHDHIRALLGGYVQAYGMENAQADGPGFVAYPKISDVPDDQGKIAAAIIAIATAIEKNPKDRAMAGDGITAEKIADLKPIVEAAKAVK